MPVDVGAKLDLKLGNKDAAYLRCGPMIWGGDRLHEREIREWGEDNLEEIIDKTPGLKENAFFIVTGQTRTKWCQFKCWHHSTRHVQPSLTNSIPMTPVDGELSVESSKELAWSGSIVYKPDKDEVKSLCQASNRSLGMILNWSFSLKVSCSFLTALAYLILPQKYNTSRK